MVKKRKLWIIPLIIIGVLIRYFPFTNIFPIYRENNDYNYNIKKYNNYIVVNDVRYNKLNFDIFTLAATPFYEKTVLGSYNGYCWIVEDEMIIVQGNFASEWYYLRDGLEIDEYLIDYIDIKNKKYNIVDNKLEEYDELQSLNYTLGDITSEELDYFLISNKLEYNYITFNLNNDIILYGKIYKVNNDYYLDIYSEDISTKKHRLRKMLIEIKD